MLHFFTSLRLSLPGHFETGFAGEGLAFKLERAQRAVISRRQLAGIFGGKFQALTGQAGAADQKWPCRPVRRRSSHGCRAFRQRRLSAAVGNPLRDLHVRGFTGGITRTASGWSFTLSVRLKVISAPREAVMPTAPEEVGSLSVPRNMATTARMLVSAGSVSRTSTEAEENGLTSTVFCENTAVAAMLLGVSPAGTKTRLPSLIDYVFRHQFKSEVTAGLVGERERLREPLAEVAFGHDDRGAERDGRLGGVGRGRRCWLREGAGRPALAQRRATGTVRKTQRRTAGCLHRRTAKCYAQARAPAVHRPADSAQAGVPVPHQFGMT